MRKIQQGFTLIELVVVITILGILAAFAIPRFASLDANARTAAISGLAGSMRSASALAHSVWLAQGSSGTVTMESTAVALTNGYPSGAVGGITAALQDVSSFTGTYAAGPPTAVTFQNNSTATAPATCQVVYTASTAVNTPPVIVLTTTGC
jgi:MSHA pilin protein MshA